MMMMMIKKQHFADRMAANLKGPDHMCRGRFVIVAENSAKSSGKCSICATQHFCQLLCWND